MRKSRSTVSTGRTWKRGVAWNTSVGLLEMRRRRELIEGEPASLVADFVAAMQTHKERASRARHVAVDEEWPRDA